MATHHQCTFCIVHFDMETTVFDRFSVLSFMMLFYGTFIMLPEYFERNEQKKIFFQLFFVLIHCKSGGKRVRQTFMKWNNDYYSCAKNQYASKNSQ